MRFTVEEHPVVHPVTLNAWFGHIAAYERPTSPKMRRVDRRGVDLIFGENCHFLFLVIFWREKSMWTTSRSRLPYFLQISFSRAFLVISLTFN